MLACTFSSSLILSHAAFSQAVLFCCQMHGGVFMELKKPETDICNEFSYCGLWACVLWITEACNDCSVSRQWGGSPSSPLEQQFVVSGLEGGEIYFVWFVLIKYIIMEWVWHQGLQVRVVWLLQTVTPRATTSILSCCPPNQSFKSIKMPWIAWIRAWGQEDPGSWESSGFGRYMLSCTPHSCRLGCICKWL